MPELIPKPSVRIHAIGADDAKGRADSVTILESRLLEHTETYPGIEEWFRRRVLPGIRTGERIGYIGFHDDRPVMAAILRKGDVAKFCHLSVSGGFQTGYLGTLMMCLMAAEARELASEIYFTLPRSLWTSHSSFFAGFGFTDATASRDQYRLFDEELYSSASGQYVWSQVLARLPAVLTSTAIAGIDLHDGIVLSLHEKFATQILEGQKTIEVRRRFSERWRGRTAAIYVAGGSGAIIGTVRIDDVVKMPPEVLWEQHRRNIGCTREEFDAYTAGAQAVFAIHLEAPVSFTAPVSISQLSYLIGEELAAPQSYVGYTSANAWGRALAVAALLHRRRSDG